MQIPNISLAYLIAELSPLLEGSILRKVQELDNNWLKLKLQTRQGTKDLIISPNAFFVTSYSLPAKQISSGFGAFLRKRISNKRILSIRQHSLDRIALLEFDEYFLVLELFAKGNVVLLDKEMGIVSAYRREQWKDRKISKGQPYKFPSSKGLSPLQITAEELAALFLESDADCIRSLVSGLNVAPIAGEEACLLAGVDKNASAKTLKPAKIKKLAKALKGIYTVDPKKLKPGIAGKQLLPFEAKAAEGFEPVESLNSALDEHFSSELAEKKEEVVASNTRGAKLEKKLKMQLASEVEGREQIENARLAAEAIYSNYPAVGEAIKLAQSFAGKKITKEEVMYKLSKLGFDDSRIDLKNKKLFVKLKG